MIPGTCNSHQQTKGNILRNPGKQSGKLVYMVHLLTMTTMDLNEGRCKTTKRKLGR